MIEPDRAVAMAEEPPTVRTVTAKIQNLPWTDAGSAALEIYQQARGLKIEDTGARVKLFFALYDGRYYNEALETIQALTTTVDGDLKFAAAVWQGHLLDLLGRRTEAVAAYQEALKTPGQPSMRHDQYGMTIDKKWVEERLKTPFDRK